MRERGKVREKKRKKERERIGKSEGELEKFKGILYCTELSRRKYEQIDLDFNKLLLDMPTKDTCFKIEIIIKYI